MEACSHQCSPCRTDAQDLTSPCLMHLDNSFGYSLRSWEQCTRMNICLHMIYTLGKMLCTRCYKLVWYPATITSLFVQPRSYNITTSDDVTYRKAQAHLKPYQPQCKITEEQHSDNNMWILKANYKQFDSIKSKINQVQSHSRLKRNIKPPVKLGLWYIQWIV